MEGERAEITPYQPPVDLDPSPALSLVGKAKPMLKGRKIGALVTDGADGDRLEALRDALEKEGAELAIVAPKIGGVSLKSGETSGRRHGAVRRAFCVLRCSRDLRLGRGDQAARSRTARLSTGFETLSGI